MTGVAEPVGWAYVIGAVSFAACFSGPLLVLAWWHSDLRQRRKAIAKGRRQLRHVEAHCDEFVKAML